MPLAPVETMANTTDDTQNNDLHGVPSTPPDSESIGATSDRAEMAAVATKVFSLVAQNWRLSGAEAAALLDAPAATWEAASGTGEPFALSDNQLQRVRAVIGIYEALESYFDEPLAVEWISRPNAGLLFNGQRPIDAMALGGLPTFLAVREYLDDLLGG